MSSDPQVSAPSWSRQEFAGLDFGDTRLNDRLVHIADAIAAQPMSPLSASCGDWSAVKAAYRFFHCPSLTMRRFLLKRFLIHTFNKRLNACGLMIAFLRSKIQPISIIPIIRQPRD